MKEVVFKSGQPMQIEVPSPVAGNGEILVDLRASCISPGTEMAGLSESGKSLFQKARENPEKLKRALDRMKNEGVLGVLQKARAGQDSEMPCGYSAAGVVDAVGAGVSGFAEGMRVAIAGAGIANHAEQAAVPVNLAVPIPENVSFEDASTCALGAIAMQGVRRADISLGDFVVVLGCGALGLLTIQILRAAGCRVIGLDLDKKRLDLAKEVGAEKIFNPNEDDVAGKVVHYCNGQGADRVIVTAATGSNEPLHQAFQMSRRKGRVVLVGVAGMDLQRADMYQKELDFVISTSYGPGRYDEQYEQKGHDYPYGYVRWTEQRNIAAYLHMLADGSVALDKIVGGAYTVDEPEKAYGALRSDDAALLVLFSYSADEGNHETHKTHEKKQGGVGNDWKLPADRTLRVGLIGTGGFVQGMHIPNLKGMTDSYKVVALCDRDALAARKAARLLELHDPRIETEYEKVLNADIDMVLIGTRHNTHAEIAIKALEAGKAVFVEKPMCITRDEFASLQKVLAKTSAPYMVGYNRRFAPAVQKIKKLVAKRVNPLMIHYTMNAGYIPYDAWVHSDEGGGRIIGEGCHIVDLFRSLVAAPVETVSVDGISPNTSSVHSEDNVVVTIKYADGSVCSLIYTSIGSKQAAKERMEVFCDEQMMVLDDYKLLEGFGAKCAWSSKRPDKGHAFELEFFSSEILKGNRFPIPLEVMNETWRISRQTADHLTA